MINTKKRRTKIKYLIFFLFSIVLCPGLYSQISDTVRYEDEWHISAGNLPEHFLETDTFKLVLVNETDSLLYFSVSMEEKIADTWVTVVADIFRHENDKHMAANVRLLMAREDKTVLWALSDMLKRIAKPFGLCRFRYVIKDSPFRPRKEIYSDSFLID